MAIAAKKEEARYAPATRVYTHTRSSVAQPEPIRPRRRSDRRKGLKRSQGRMKSESRIQNAG